MNSVSLNNESKCPDCDGQLVYQRYTIRIGNSGPLHIYKCDQCSAKFHFMSAPKQNPVLVHNN